MSYRGAELFEQHITAELRRCRPFIESALLRCGGTHEWDDVVYMVRRRTAQFFPGNECAIITEVIDAPGFRYCCIWLAGGELEELLELEKHVAHWAKELGCKKIVANGRAGWERVLKDYSRAYVAYEKDL